MIMKKRNILFLFTFLILVQIASAQESTAYFDMDACTASPGNGTNQDFSEFTPVFTNDAGCDIMSIDHLYRVNPMVNSHSCTPGVNDSEGMCVSYDAGCDYNPGSEKSVIIDVTLTPGSSGGASLNHLSFFEKSNPEYDWIGGNSGDNNYPTQFGIRVLKDGVEIYTQNNIATNIEWTEMNFDFAGLVGFSVTEETVFSIEMLAYCPVGNGSFISVWDIDEITITSTCCGGETDGGTLEGGPFEFCVGDGESDNISDGEITLSGNVGPNFQWVITDAQGNILGLPPTLDVVDFEGAGEGNCLIWNLAFEDGLMGAEVGANASDLIGCYDLSNPIEVIRNEPMGGALEGGPFEFCVGDGVADNIPAGAITLTGNTGPNSQWVVTDSDGIILGLPPAYEAVDFDGAGEGNCLVWHLSFEDGLTGAAVGENATDLGGCFSLSNPISVVRNQPIGGTLEGGPFAFCVGDGVVDTIATGAITLSGNSGTNSQWVVTDSDGMILGLPPTYEAVDFDGAGEGTCLVWHLSFEDGLTGAEMGANASDLEGCFSLSNPISVIRGTADGGTLEGGPFAFCVGDGIADTIATGMITLSGISGMNSQWVVTDSDGMILGLPPTYEAVDFDGAGAGTCLVWHLSFADGLMGAAVGNNASDLTGCFDLSNPIEVVRTEVNGGTLEGGPFAFCVGDGIADTIATGLITLSGNVGANSQWVVTDADGMILGLPPTYEAVDFDGAGVGACLVWHLSFEDGLTGADVGNNASDLEGCFSLSNPIEVVRNNPVGGSLEGGPFEFCTGNGEADNIPAGAITLSGNSGMNSQWVVTDSDGNILGLPPSYEMVDFDDAPAGTCLVWHLSFADGLLGAEVGSNTIDLLGCFSLSNPIEVVRLSPNGGDIEGGPFEFCVGDGEADTIATGLILLSGNTGANSQWVVTDADGMILGLPPTYEAVDFDGAGVGACLVWHLSFEDGLTGAEVGNNASDLEGCFSLSNPIEVVRVEGDDCPEDCPAEGGVLEGGPFEFCVGDGVADTIATGLITLSGNMGTNSQWVVTDADGMILGLPPTYEAVDFDGAGVGACLVWHLSFEDGLMGAEVGANASDIEGCFDLSNPITVVRNSPNGGMLEGGPFEFCAGDGVADTIATGLITLSGNMGTNSQWVITDDQLNILGLPPTYEAVDFDGAGAGNCLVWHLSFEDGLMGAEVGANAADLVGCFSLSNSIEVVRTQPNGGTLEGGPFEFCVGDGVADTIATGLITLSGNTGMNSQWVVTDADGMILGLPPTYEAVDFDGAGVGACLVWHLSFEDGLTGAEVGNNASDLEGCFSLSNPIEVVRVEGDDCPEDCPAEGGVLEGGPFEFCVGDGVADTIATGLITLSGNMGTNSQWVVTDADGMILGLPPTYEAVDFDGAGVGACLVWHLSFEDGLMGAEVGANASDIEGCFDLSNPITVVRNSPNGGMLEGGPFEFCAGDGVADTIATGLITLSGNMGTNSQWVITDDQLNILGLPPTYEAVDFDGAGAGNCLVWHLSFEDGLMGAEVGANAADLVGCFSLSNSIEVVRTQPNGGTLEGGPFAFCVGDGEIDTIETGMITLSGNTGTNSQWVVTDSDGMILGLPSTYEAVDFEGAGTGVCLVWHLSFEDGLTGAAVGNNASDLMGCFNLSNPIEVTRVTGADCTNLAPNIVMNEINLNTEIELKNIGLAPQNISGWWLCRFPTYVLVDDLIIVCGDDLIIDPGEILTLQTGILLSADDGEMALYIDDGFGNSNSIVDYVEWGSTGHQRSSVAVAAGIWTTGDFVPDWTGAASIEYDGEGNSSSNWNASEGSICMENFTSVGDVFTMTVYPNPTAQDIKLELNGRINVEATISIYDMFGQRLRDFSDLKINGVKTLDVSMLRTGKYVLMIETDNQVESTTFVVIR